MASFPLRRLSCQIERETGRGLKLGSRPNAFKGVIEVNEFQMHLRWLAEQRRLADLERRWREAERQALRELYLASLAEDDDDQDLEVTDNGEGEGESNEACN